LQSLRRTLELVEVGASCGSPATISGHRRAAYSIQLLTLIRMSRPADASTARRLLHQ
jgi:hypothetical protein